MAFSLMLPGQPVQLPVGPVPKLGGGIYSLDGQVRASLLGVPSYKGSVGSVSIYLMRMLDVLPI
jgi:exosome complex component CSL4